MASLSVLTTLLDHRRTAVAVALVSYVIVTCVYRRYFHPLAKVPGPLLPAVTKLYQTWFNYRYYLQIERLHARYGPIVRINPNEVHIADAETYEKIYFMGSTFPKEPDFYDSMGALHSTFGTSSNELHKIKRGAMNPMFSRRKVLDLEYVVQDKAHKVCERVQEGIDDGRPTDLHHALRAVSVDVISDFAFDRCYNFLDQPDIGEKFFRMARGFGPPFYAFQLFPILNGLPPRIPEKLGPNLPGPFGYMMGMQMECVRQVRGVQERVREGKDLGRQTIFTTLLTEEDKPNGYYVPNTWQLKDEAFSVLVAAADTTGNAMTIATFNTLYHDNIYGKLAAELEQAFPHQTENLPFVELEKLPYLTAVIKEGLRLSFGVIGRLPRLVPAPGITLNGHYLPAGSIVGMSSWMMHRDPTVFDNPDQFDPERWLKSPEQTHRLDRNMVPFGKGSRQCIGMPLAYAELYVTIGSLFRRFPRGLRVYNTSPSTMRDYEDYFSSYHPDSKRNEWLRVCMNNEKDVS